MRTLAACMFLPGLIAAGAAGAEEKYPARPVRLLVGFAPGSGADFMARTVGQKLGDAWGQQVVVDNRPGGNGVIASETLVRARPDGQTLIVVSIGHATAAALNPKLPYDVARDFAGVTLLTDTANVLIVAPALGVKTMREFIDLAKARPGQLNFGSGGGVGSGSHMNTELFNQRAGISTVHVKYKGAADVMTNMIGGAVHYYFAPITAAVPLIRAGRILGLAVTTKERTAAAPELPTVAESGLPGFDYNNWYGMLAPAGTPAALKRRIAGDVARVLELREVKEHLLSQGATPHPTAPEAFDRMIREETARMAKLIRDAGIRLE